MTIEAVAGAGRGVLGVILAGGEARRMGGGDKCLRELGGQTLLARLIDTVRPQVDALVLNANGDPARFASYGLPVLADVVEGSAGPLAGILTGLRHAAAAALGSDPTGSVLAQGVSPQRVASGAAEQPPATTRLEWIATFPGDAPFLPADLVARMRHAAETAGADLACAASGGRTHPVVGLWKTALADDLEHTLTVEGVRKIDAWTARHRLVEIEWPAEPVDPFFNANRPDDLAEAERLLARLQSRGANA